MSPLRILVTGSRDWRDETIVADALSHALATYSTIGLSILVHGGAQGADTIADRGWRKWMNSRPGWLTEPEIHAARDHSTPLARNQHMVDLGATVCLAFAMAWRSGTGNCARSARVAGISTIDYGVDTRIEARP